MTSSKLVSETILISFIGKSDHMLYPLGNQVSRKKSFSFRGNNLTLNVHTNCFDSDHISRCVQPLITYIGK